MGMPLRGAKTRLCAAAILALTAAAPEVAAQQSPFALAARASIVVKGTVTRSDASDEPLVPASSRTAVIRISTMLAGGEFAGNLNGQSATVVLAGAGSPPAGAEMWFFGNPRYAGKSLTIADIGEVPVAEKVADADLARGVLARRDAPLRARLATASAVFRGVVEKIVPVASTTPTSSDVNEHDPEFRLAWVRVRSAMSGPKAGALTPVLFPASDDVMWFNHLKLKVGADVVVIGHAPQDQERPLLRTSGALAVIEKTGALLAMDVSDLLPGAQQEHVLTLLRTKEAPQ